MGYIYRHTNLINGKVYIGQTIQEVKERNAKHMPSAFGASTVHNHNSKFHCALREWGKENFKLDILEQVDNSLLNERERYYIALYDSFNNGYNATLGGDALATDFPLTEAEKARVNSMFINGVSIKKIAKLTGHHYRKIMRSLKEDLNYTDSDIRQRYLALKGKPTQVPVLQINMNLNVVKEYDSIKSAAIGAGVSSAWLNKILNQYQIPKCRGYYWVKKNEYNHFLKTIKTLSEVTI